MNYIVLLVFEATMFSVIWMLGAWLIYCYFNNPAIVDLAWTLCVGCITYIYFFSAGELKPVSVVILVAMSIWTLRLVALLVYRFNRDKVDRRYETLDKKWSSSLKRNYLFFFQFQGLGAVLISLPIAFSITATAPYIWLDALATLFVFIGIVGVCIADFQLQTCIRNAQNSTIVCEKGLWQYSRHPNYFFEWVFWVGQSIFALHLEWGYIALISPLVLLYTILFVTGIPPAEEQSLRSKGLAYQAYQKTTSTFIPWFKKGNN